MKFLVKVEEAKEGDGKRTSMGPVYRSVFAKDGFPEPVPGLDSCWDVFRISVQRNPQNPMLGRRETVDGKPGKYMWMTYQEVYDIVMKVGLSIRSCGVEPGGRCGIYGANCPEWLMSMEACNAHGIYCVPLYDTLGAGAVEFIICHAEVSIAFVEERKITEMLKILSNSSKCLKTIVSFGKFTDEQREKVEEFGLAAYSWDDFLLLELFLSRFVCQLVFLISNEKFSLKSSDEALTNAQRLWMKNIDFFSILAEERSSSYLYFSKFLSLFWKALPLFLF